MPDKAKRPRHYIESKHKKALKGREKKARHHHKSPGLPLSIIYPRDTTEGASDPEIPMKGEYQRLPKVFSLQPKEQERSNVERHTLLDSHCSTPGKYHRRTVAPPPPHQQRPSEEPRFLFISPAHKKEPPTPPQGCCCTRWRGRPPSTTVTVSGFYLM